MRRQEIRISGLLNLATTVKKRLYVMVGVGTKTTRSAMIKIAGLPSVLGWDAIKLWIRTPHGTGPVPASGLDTGKIQAVHF